tara:strand:- start:300 stop:1715 length:1416 start_codon:yes stop_codon:yes gene_type:complete
MDLLHESKLKATNLFKASYFTGAARTFAALADEASDKAKSMSDSDIALIKELKTLTCAGYSNASMCHLKEFEFERAADAARRCIDSFAGFTVTQFEPEFCGQIDFNVNKARFRLSTALINLVESDTTNDENGFRSENLECAQKELSLILTSEPDNEQALLLATKGLEIFSKHRSTTTTTTTTKPIDDEELLLAALGENSDKQFNQNNSGWGMTPNWLDTDKNNDNSNSNSNIQIYENLKSVNSTTFTSPTTSNSTVSDLVTNLLPQTASFSSFSKQNNNSKKVWDTIQEQTHKEEQSFNTIVANLQARPQAKTSQIANKTTENNYSSSWRKQHAARRFEGKEATRTVSSGASAWAELNEYEKSAVDIVEKTEKTKKMLVENLIPTTPTVKSNDKAWRKTLNQRRRKGEEIALEKKKSSNEFKSLMGLEDSEIERVHKLNADRKVAERKAVKTKKILTAQRNKINKNNNDDM